MDQEQDSLHLQHLSVQADEDWQGNTDGKMPKGKGGKGGKFGGKKYVCKGKKDISAECLNSYYTRLGDNNEKEWWISLENWWWNQLWLALFGPFLIMSASWMSWITLLFPDMKPSTSNAPWKNEE